MQNELSASARDILWLLKKVGAATEAELEKFCEKVAILIEDYGVDENKARTMAYNEYFGGYSHLN